MHVSHLGNCAAFCKKLVCTVKLTAHASQILGFQIEIAMAVAFPIFYVKYLGFTYLFGLRSVGMSNQERSKADCFANISCDAK